MYFVVFLVINTQIKKQNFKRVALNRFLMSE
jgi:hypothetical protein